MEGEVTTVGADDTIGSAAKMCTTQQPIDGGNLFAEFEPFRGYAIPGYKLKKGVANV
jgi:hypothetical protein